MLYKAAATLLFAFVGSDFQSVSIMFTPDSCNTMTSTTFSQHLSTYPLPLLFLLQVHSRAVSKVKDEAAKIRREAKIRQGAAPAAKGATGNLFATRMTRDASAESSKRRFRKKRTQADVGLLPRELYRKEVVVPQARKLDAVATCGANGYVDCVDGTVRDMPGVSCASACDGDCCLGDSACGY